MFWTWGLHAIRGACCGADVILAQLMHARTPGGSVWQGTKVTWQFGASRKANFDKLRQTSTFRFFMQAYYAMVESANAGIWVPSLSLVT